MQVSIRGVRNVGMEAEAMHILITVPVALELHERQAGGYGHVL